jgi:alcohol dehydrogenase, propanol-preferring
VTGLVKISSRFTNFVSTNHFIIDNSLIVPNSRVRHTRMGSIGAGTMKAGQYDPKQQRCVVNEIPIPEPGPGQFLVKIVSASLCHSDMLAIGAIQDKPLTLGHEGAGYIHKFGARTEDKGFKVGDCVGFLYFDGGCYECEGCLAHNSKCTVSTPLLHGFAIDGFFQEYATVDWQNCIILPPQLDIRKASPIFCAGITAFHAVDSCNLKPGQFFAAIGAGGLGQLAVQYAKAMQLEVIAIDINDDTLAVAKSQGANHVFNSKSDPDYVQKIKDLTKGGCHAAAVFSASGAAYASAPSILRVNGILMAIGITNQPLQISTYDLAVASYQLKAESTSTPQRMPKAIEFTAKHNIMPEVEFRKLEELDDMCKEMKAGQSQRRKVVVFD